MAGVKFEVKDSFDLKGMMKELQEVAKEGPIRGSAGIDESAGATPRNKGELTNLEIALIHEYGAIIPSRSGVHVGEQGQQLVISGATFIPERSFIRSTFDENQNKYDQRIIELAGKVYERKIHLEEACARVALQLSKDIRKKVESGLKPDLSPDWLTRKKSGDPRPLIDTGEMLMQL
jgi:hypothetical protein